MLYGATLRSLYADIAMPRACKQLMCGPSILGWLYNWFGVSTDQRLHRLKEQHAQDCCPQRKLVDACHAPNII
jgi:hypothetical protein